MNENIKNVNKFKIGGKGLENLLQKQINCSLKIIVFRGSFFNFYFFFNFVGIVLFIWLVENQCIGIVVNFLARCARPPVFVYYSEGCGNKKHQRNVLFSDEMINVHDD